MKPEDKPEASGTFIGKDDALESIHPMVLEFLKHPGDIFSPEPEPIEGQLVDDFKLPLPEALTASMNYEIKVDLKDWLDFMDKSPAGVDPVLGDFLRANPHHFDPSRAEGDGVTPRFLKMTSDSLVALNRINPTIEKGATWIAPKKLMDSYLGQKVADEFISFAENMGLKVQSQPGKEVKRSIDRDLPSQER